jgi:cytochrome c-type biogenesis protein CcmE
MKRNKLKFAVGSAVIVATLVYLAFTSAEGNKLYSKSIADLKAPSENLYKQRLTVAGTVVHGSIERIERGTDRVVKFTIHDKENKAVTFPVEYQGKAPLPDLFRDNADVNVDGHLDRSGVFIGDTVAAKCASKYEKELEAGLLHDANGNVIVPPGNSSEKKEY